MAVIQRTGLKKTPKTELGAVTLELLTPSLLADAASEASDESVDIRNFMEAESLDEDNESTIEDADVEDDESGIDALPDPDDEENEEITDSDAEAEESDTEAPTIVEADDDDLSIDLSALNMDSPRKLRKKDKKVKHFNSKEIVPQFKLPNHLEEYHVALDGTKIFPADVEIYSELPISEDTARKAKEIAEKSFFIDSDGDMVSCLVLRTKQVYCTIKKNSENQLVMSFMMSTFDIVKKVRGSDGIVYCDIVVRDELGEKKIRVPASQFAENAISGLSRYGIILNGFYKGAMSVYFLRLINRLPMEDASQVLGIISDPEGNLSFNAYDTDGFVAQTQYHSFDEYVTNLNQLLDSAPLQYLICATMAAPLLTILQKRYKYDVTSYTINIVSASSRGKTISSQVCASMWTEPQSDKIFSSALSTSNAVIRRLSGRWGIPTIINEGSILGGISPTEFAYTVAEQTEKRRLNSDCSEKASGTWSTIVLISSENHFHSNHKNQNGGLAIRVHSIENLTYTKDKQQADELSSFIRLNYGLVGQRFMDILLKKELNNIEDRYLAAVDAMREYIADDMNPYSERLLKTYALTYATAELLSEMGLEIDIDAVAKIMASHNAMVSDEQNLGHNAFKALVSYITRNPARIGIRKFIDEDTKFLTKVAIEESLMSEILTKAGFTDAKVAVKQLDAEGYLIRQGKGAGLKSKLTIDETLCYCYQIDFSTLNEGVESKQEWLDSVLNSGKEEYYV